MVLAWKEAVGSLCNPKHMNSGAMVMPLELANRSFKAVTTNLSIAVWVFRACAKHQRTHEHVDIPMLVAKNGYPLKTRPCPPIYYYEQLLEDLKHVVALNFEPILRTISNPVPQSSGSPLRRKSRSAPNSPSSAKSSSGTDAGHDVWHTQRKSSKKKKAPTTDEYFQEVGKCIH
jgi:hypothetical protein